MSEGMSSEAALVISVWRLGEEGAALAAVDRVRVRWAARCRAVAAIQEMKDLGHAEADDEVEEAARIDAVLASILPEVRTIAGLFIKDADSYNDAVNQPVVALNLARVGLTYSPTDEERAALRRAIDAAEEKLKFRRAELSRLVGRHGATVVIGMIEHGFDSYTDEEIETLAAQIKATR